MPVSGTGKLLSMQRSRLSAVGSHSNAHRINISPLPASRRGHGAAGRSSLPAGRRLLRPTRPDPSVPAQRVAFGTSGHRGSSFERSFNESHVLAISQAICLYRKRQGIDGPLFIGIDTHALSVPAFESALEVLAANRRRGADRAGRRIHADAGGFARHPGLQPRPQDAGWPTAS